MAMIGMTVTLPKINACGCSVDEECPEHRYEALVHDVDFVILDAESADDLLDG